MTKLYTTNRELIFDEPTLTLKEAVEKHKDKLEGANLEGANLSETDLRESDLTGVDLSKTNLQDCCLSGAFLERVIFNKEQIAQDLLYLFGDDESKYTEVLGKYKIAKFDAIAITKLVFDLSKQLCKMVLKNNN